MPSPYSSFPRRALMILALSIAGSVVAVAQTETLRFDELPVTPLNGLSFRGATFTFTVGGVGSTDANYGSGGPGQATFIQDPSAEGSANGTLTIAFDTPTLVLSFGLARPALSPLTPGATIQLFDASRGPDSDNQPRLDPVGALC